MFHRRAKISNHVQKQKWILWKCSVIFNAVWKFVLGWVKYWVSYQYRHQYHISWIPPPSYLQPQPPFWCLNLPPITHKRVSIYMQQNHAQQNYKASGHLMVFQAGSSYDYFMKNSMLINIYFKDLAKIESSFSLYF